MVLGVLILSSCGSGGDSPPQDAALEQASDVLLDGGEDGGAELKVVAVAWGGSGALFDVHGSGANNVWFLGREPYRFDGQSWSAHDTVSVAPGGAVWARSPSEVWVSPSWRYDGKSWKNVGLGQTSGLVRDLWGAPQGPIYAATGGSSASGFFGEVASSSGGAFQRRHHLDDQFLHAVWGSGPNDIWVAGAPVGQQTRLLHYDGDGWSPIVALPLPHTVAAMSGLSRALIFAAGGEHLLRYDGEAWSEVGSAPTWGLQDVMAFAADDVWVVGKGGSVLRYDGKELRAVNVGSSADFFGVWGPSPELLYLVGAAKSGGVALRLER